jgi:hypothetical protein
MQPCPEVVGGFLEMAKDTAVTVGFVEEHNPSDSTLCKGAHRRSRARGFEQWERGGFMACTASFRQDLQECIGIIHFIRDDCTYRIFPNQKCRQVRVFPA